MSGPVGTLPAGIYPVGTFVEEDSSLSKIVGTATELSTSLGINAEVVQLMPITYDVTSWVPNFDGTISEKYKAGDKPATSFPYDNTRTPIVGAYHVDPISGSDSNDGILVSEGGTGPWATINPNLATLAAGDTMYLRSGTHNVTTIAMKFGYANGTLGNEITIESYPGDTPVVDCGGVTWMEQFDQRNYWRFRHFKIQNYLMGWWAGSDVDPENCTWYSLEGETGIDGDNVGLIRNNGMTNFTIDRVRLTFTGDPLTAHQNTGGLYQRDAGGTTTGIYNRIEVYNFPIGIYFKFGDEDIPSYNGNVQVKNAYFSGNTRNSLGYNAAGVLFENIITDKPFDLAEDDGGEAGDWNWLVHATIFDEFRLRDQDGGGSQPGAKNNRITDSIVTSLIIEPNSSVTSTSDYNLFVNDIDDKGVMRDLASWQTANSSDANSLQGTPIYVGGATPSDIAGYALAVGSPGKNAASDGTDMGADVTKVGVSG